jgi:3-hydroxy acid dehydrogenase / malonic semialdehyde reductase
MSAALADRTVVVTGASSGIGRALAGALVAGGARVIAAARSADKLQALADELGAALVPVAADVADPGAVERLAAAAGRVDAVVNNAGIGYVEPFVDSDPARWRQTLDTNLVGALLVTRAFLPGMLAAGAGLIVNVGSASASGWPYLTLYAASKAALQAASLALDREHAGRGVRVQYVEVGPTAGTGFGVASDPSHLPTAARAWTELGIAWRTDVATPETTARVIVGAIERGLAG